MMEIRHTHTEKKTQLNFFKSSKNQLGDPTGTEAPVDITILF